MAKKMDRKVRRKSWIRFFFEWTLLSLLFIFIYGYFQCPSTQGKGSKSDTAFSHSKAVIFAHNSVCNSYQAIHTSAAYRAVDNSLRQGIRKVLKEPWVVEKRKELNRTWKKVRATKAYQASRQVVLAVVKNTAPVLGEARDFTVALGYQAFRFVVKTTPIVRDHIVQGWVMIESSDAFKSTKKTIVDYYQERVVPIYKESVSPLVQKYLVETGVYGTVSAGIGKVSQLHKQAVTFARENFADEIGQFEKFFQELTGGSASATTAAAGKKK